MAMNELKERVSRLEDFVGAPETDDAVNLAVQFERQKEELTTLKADHDALKVAHAGLTNDTETKFKSMLEDFVAFIDAVKGNVKSIEEEMAVLKRALNNPSAQDGAASKIRVPSPDTFSGTRSSKELENFLWDMEQYFRAARIPDNEKVTITSMYLSGDAKLWWRTRMADDASAGRPRIADWGTLKKELKDQFLPGNTAWVARENLRKLKHTGSMRDYVKDFSSLILDIVDMSESDKLFNFLSGLQGWAQTELHRQGVKDLPTAIAAADRLVDLRPSSSSVAEKSDGKKNKPYVKDGKRSTNSMTGESSKSKDQLSVKTSGCFICEGPHRAKHCPLKKQLSALTLQEEGKTNDSVDTDVVRVNPMQLLNTITMEKPTPTKGLMYVMVRVNGVEVRAMLDTGATNNFLSEKVVKSLGLKVTQSTCKLKAVNSRASKVEGTTMVTLGIGSWEGECNLTIVSLDDFELILGIEFFVRAKVTLMPHLFGILVADEKYPCFVRAENEGKQREIMRSVSTHASVTHVGALQVIEPDEDADIVLGHKTMNREEYQRPDYLIRWVGGIEMDAAWEGDFRGKTRLWAPSDEDVGFKKVGEGLLDP